MPLTRFASVTILSLSSLEHPVQQQYCRVCSIAVIYDLIKRTENTCTMGDVVAGAMTMVACH